MKPSTLGENRSTVPLVLLMETQHKLEIGARIRELRSRSPYTQANIADRLGITLRAYQRLEEVGTTRWERCVELGELHGVSPEYIWDGEEKPQTPDLMRQLNGSSSEQLDRIEGKLDEVLRNWDARWALLEADETGQETSQSEPRSVPGSSSRARRRRARG